MARAIKTFQQFKNALETNKELQEKFKTNPIDAVKEIDRENPLNHDKWIYRIIVIGLSIAILLALIGAIVLALAEKTNNTVLTIFTATASTAIGALAGLLVPAPQEN